MELPNDEILRELFPEFIDSWLADMRVVLPQLIHNQNKSDLKRLGHTLKGSAAQFGVMELRELGIEMMECADRSEFEKVAEVSEKIIERLLEIRRFLDSIGV